MTSRYVSDINAIASRGLTPHQHAAYVGYIERIDNWLKHGAGKPDFGCNEEINTI